MAEFWEAVARRARTFTGAYVLSVAGVVAATAASLTGRWWVSLAGFVVLGLVFSRFREVVRLLGDDGGRRRVVVALVQLVVGALVAALAWTGRLPGADTVFLLGIVLAIMAAGALVGELRGLPGSEPVRPATIVVAGLAGLLVAAFLAAVLLDRWWLVAAALVVLLVGVVLVDLRIRSTSWRRRPGVALLAGAVVLLLAGTFVDGPWFVGAVLSGIVAGALGTELLSEDSHRWRWERWPRGLALAAGAVLLLAAGLVSVAMGAETWHVVFLLLGLVAVAVMASSDGDSLLLVGLVVLALLWTATPPAPTTERSDAPRQVEAGDDYFLVLGDSYMSGEGAEEFLAGTNTTDVDHDDHINECRRAPTAWALRLARYKTDDLDEVIPARALFLACSGAVAANIDTQPRIEEGERMGPAELDLFRRREAELGQPEFVLIQVGGNDARFGDIGPACIGPGNCAELGQQFLDDLADIGDDLDAAYQRIQAEVDDDVPIIAVPYPIPLSATNACDDVLLSGDEQAFVVGFVRQLNRMVRSAARRNGLLYMQPMEASLRRSGTVLCDESGLSAGINFLAFNPKEGRLGERLNPTNWTHNSLHPNAAGHEALHDTAIDWFEDNAELTIPEPNPDHRHQVAPLERVFTDRRQIPQCVPSDETSCITDGYAWHLDQLRETYPTALVVLTPAMVGAWLLLLWPMCIARDRGISLAKVVRGTLRREPRPPREEPASTTGGMAAS